MPNRKKKYDIIVIGSGSAGFSAIEAARSEGARICLIEKNMLGGECPNFACVPSKAVLRAAHVYRLCQQARRFGMAFTALSFDFSQVMQHRARAVEHITGGGARGNRYEKILQAWKIPVYYGVAVFVDAHTIRVSEVELEAKVIVIATGSVEAALVVPGIDRMKYLTSKDALQLKQQPKSLAIIGGGPVGCELATFFATFGTRVVLLQSAPLILHREDHEISHLAELSLQKLGVEIITGSEVKEILHASPGICGIRTQIGRDEKIFAVEQCLVAVGKRSCVEGLALETAKVELNDRGVIVTTKEQRTSVKHIFSAGDVDGGMLFTHTAHHEGWIAGYNAALVAKGSRKPMKKTDVRVVPRVTFLSEEVASVGETQEEAQKKYKKVLVGRFDLSLLSRAVTDHTRFGLVKIVAHPKTRKILGGHVMGERAGELIHEIALGLKLGATIDDLASMIHAFPSYAEAVKAAASNPKLE